MELREVNKEDLLNIYRDLLITLTSKAIDKRSYTSIDRITKTLNNISKKLIGGDFEINSEEINSILEKLTYKSYTAVRKYKDQKSSFFDRSWEELKFEVDVVDINEINSLKSVFSSKNNRREDRQIDLEKLLTKFYKIVLDYYLDNEIDPSYILTTKLTEPLFFELREKFKRKI